MLEYANLLLEITDYQNEVVKYIPIDSETENMTIGEVIDSLKIEEPLTEIVYNDNNKSHILDFINFVPINGTNDNQKVWRVAIYKLMAAILEQREKGIPREYMYDKIRQAMLAAFRRDNPECADNVDILLDESRKRIEMYVNKTAVEEVEDPALEIQIDAAKKITKRAKLGDTVKVPVETKKFGRIAAQAAKQVIIQGIREAERGIIYEEFTSKEHEILSGVVSRIEPRTGSVSIRISSNSEFTEAMLAPNERIKTEVLTEGDRIKVYVVEVRNSTRGPQVLISRTHPGLVKRLFELEVPEIYDGTVEIKSIAREAGSRTKMSVWSTDADVDPIGACVGPKGGRVANIVDELGGEKIDIIKYSETPEEYIAAALAPSEVVSVTMFEDGKSCRVIVPDSQLSLAIGKEGQNARLAAKLTGFKIDIKPESEA